jgi:hypothetical protein
MFSLEKKVLLSLKTLSEYTGVNFIETAVNKLGMQALR